MEWQKWDQPWNSFYRRDIRSLPSMERGYHLPFHTSLPHYSIWRVTNCTSLQCPHQHPTIFPFTCPTTQQTPPLQWPSTYRIPPARNDFHKLITTPPHLRHLLHTHLPLHNPNTPHLHLYLKCSSSLKHKPPYTSTSCHDCIVVVISEILYRVSKHQ